jgi:hypothetical protein
VLAAVGGGGVKGRTMDAELEARDEVRRAIARLRPRLRLVVALRYGLGRLGGDVLGYGEIGAALGVTWKRVWQLEREALSEVRLEVLAHRLRGRRLARRHRAPPRNSVGGSAAGGGRFLVRTGQKSGFVTGGGR